MVVEVVVEDVACLVIIFLNIMYVDIRVQSVSNRVQIVMQIRMWFLNKLISGEV